MGHTAILPDEMPPRGGFILPETLVLAGLSFRRWSIIAGGDILYKVICRDEAPPMGRDSSLREYREIRGGLTTLRIKLQVDLSCFEY